VLFGTEARAGWVEPGLAPLLWQQVRTGWSHWRAV